MKRILFLFFIISSFGALAQKNDSILYFPLRSGDIEMEGRVLEMLKRNQVSVDSARIYIVSTTTTKLKENFWNCIAPENDPRYKALRDSLGLLSQWNSFQIKKIRESSGFKKLAYANDDNEKNKYYGRIMNKYWLDGLRSLMKENNSKYTICLNKFEITNGNAFKNDVSFILHLEVYDENANKVFGYALRWEHPVSKYTSYYLFQYWIRNALDDFNFQLKEYISTN